MGLGKFAREMKRIVKQWSVFWEACGKNNSCLFGSFSSDLVYTEVEELAEYLANMTQMRCRQENRLKVN